MRDGSQPQPGATQVANPNSFYDQLNRAVFHGESEKSFVDKLLGRQDADRLHGLIKKEPLTMSDVEEMLFLMTSIDQKILNYNAWDRYVVVKLFPWVKDFSTVCKTMMQYQQQYEQGKFTEDFKDKAVEKEIIEIIKEINKYLLHNLKFLISVFLLVSNTTLSLDGAAFETLTTSRFEYSYPMMPMPQPQEKRNILNVFGKR